MSPCIWREWFPITGCRGGGGRGAQQGGEAQDCEIFHLFVYLMMNTMLIPARVIPQ